MRWNTILMLGLAVVFGAGAIFAGQQWLARQALLQRQQIASVQKAPVAVPTGTIVVAAQALRYGVELSARHLREIRWPEEAIPAGAFRTAAELLGDQGKRVVLTAIEANEPILPGKVTGPGQRGTLSTLLDDGMGAVTVQVNEVVGVAGFVLPGDRVDVLVTRQVRAVTSEGAGQQNAFSDLVLQNLRVLAIGQVADERADKPSVVNAVTLEVDAIGAQRIAVAASAGALSLMLRKAGEVAARPGRRVSLAEIGQDSAPAAVDRGVVVRVTRATKREEYAVPAAAQARVTEGSPQLVRAQ
jgi:pilus assembly protein CpaB